MDVQWTRLFQDREQSRALVDTVLNLRVPQTAEKLLDQPSDLEC
jgi:hypothetical protein